ncbi:MAG TPA: hypothetical protein VKQ27_08800 [Acetobacteraceae bacterium]|nr:hypothetical protein [Acetobacteraceae bacterium]
MKRQHHPMSWRRRPSGVPGDPELRSLEHYKRNPDRVPAGRMVRIWSAEWSAFWRPNGCGYTTQLAEAGRFLIQDAFAKTRGCDPDKRIWFAFIAPGDTGALARAERHWYEDLGDVLWWKFPVTEAPWVGTPLDSSWPGYHTHWTPLPPMPHKPKRGGQWA